MCTTIKEAISESQSVKAGVPQGSILDPTLFNIYINDIPTTKDTQLAIYADDTASWNSTQASKYLQTHVNLLTEYFKKWKSKENTIHHLYKLVQPSKKIQIYGYDIQ